jgi:hypothetical protein
MDKYYELFKDVEDLFLNAISAADLEHKVNIKVLGCKNQKEVTKVAKATPITKYLGNMVDVIITVNEAVFEQLNELHKQMVVDETLAEIGWDNDKDKLVISKPDFSTFTLILKKYSCDEMLAERDVVKAAYSQKASGEEPEEIRV